MSLLRRPRTPGRLVRRPHRRPAVRIAVAVTVAVTLTACGATPSVGPATTSAAAAHPSPHEHTPGMRMNGAGPAPGTGTGTGTARATTSVTDARRVTGRRLVRGPLTGSPGRPAGTEAVTGTAWLASGATGTTVTVEVTGLPPRTWFMVHLRVGPCADADAAASTFPAGPAGPAHELHVMFQTRADGTATVSEEDSGDVGGAVRSVAVLPESMTGQVACADLA